MILGCDAAGIGPDGREVIVHAVVNAPDFVGSDATYDARRSLLSERYPGTLAEQVWVPAANLVDKPVELTFAEAACLPTAWLTAYRMLFTARAPGPVTPSWSRAPAGEWRPRWSCSVGAPASGCGSPRATRPGGPGRSTSGPTVPSRPARGCPSGSTP